MRGPLQMSLFGAGMLDTVQVTEIYGSDPGGVFDVGGLNPLQVPTSWGDIVVMCNALYDYADILLGVIEEWGLSGLHAETYLTHAARCRKIAKQYAGAVGYDYDKAMKDCRKRRAERAGDIGEDALTLTVKGASA